MQGKKNEDNRKTGRLRARGGRERERDSETKRRRYTEKNIKTEEVIARDRDRRGKQCD